MAVMVRAAVVIAASTPTDCFDAAFWAGKLAVEHMTPVILLTDAFIANGSSAWRIPEMDKYPEIKPNYVANYQDEKFGRRIVVTRKAWFVTGRFRERKVSLIVWAVWRKTTRRALSLPIRLTTRRW